MNIYYLQTINEKTQRQGDITDATEGKPSLMDK